MVDMAKTKEGAQVYDRLKELLINHSLGLGTSLAVNDLADRFRLSTTPVRESLIRLQREGFLNSVPHRGFQTKYISEKGTSELYNVIVMLLLRSIAIWSSRRPNDLCLEQIECNADHASAAGHLHPIDDLYDQIVDRSWGESIVSVYQNARERTRFVRRVEFDSDVRNTAAVDRAQEIVSALRAGNRAKAAASIEVEFEDSLRMMPQLISLSIQRCEDRHVCEARTLPPTLTNPEVLVSAVGAGWRGNDVRTPTD